MTEFEIDASTATYTPFPWPAQTWAVKTSTGPGTVTLRTAAPPPAVPERPGWLRLTGPTAAALRPGTAFDSDGLRSMVLWVNGGMNANGHLVTVARLVSPATFRGRHLVQAALRQGQVYARRRTWCSNCGRYAGRLDREGQCERCAAWWRANPLPVEAAGEVNDWEDSTICRSCSGDVYPRKLFMGYCQACLNDAAEGAEDEYDGDDWHVPERECRWCGGDMPWTPGGGECAACREEEQAREQAEAQAGHEGA